MNITRRGFLQALLAIPAIAALPKINEVVAGLPVVEGPTDDSFVVETWAPLRHSSWLIINGVPVECQSVSVTTYQDSIIAAEIGSTMQHTINGVARHEMDVVLAGREPSLRDAFLADEPVTIEARFGAATLRARGRFVSCVIEDPPGLPLRTQMTAMLFGTEWEAA